jgi:hypothetical protein
LKCASIEKAISSALEKPLKIENMLKTLKCASIEKAISSALEKPLKIENMLKDLEKCFN